MGITKLSRVVLLAGLLCAGSTIVVAQMRYLTEDHRLHKSFHSKFLPKDRDVIVWLPPGYDSNPTKRYPVLYMHDGNTVFGLWRLDETAQALISNKQIEPLIIVCVGNGGTAEDRFDEYTPPTQDPRLAKGGKANQYGRMLVEELKPFIDSEYRTLTDASNTGLGGGSLGGLVTLYLGLKYPGTFGRLAVISPSVWWDRGMIIREVNSLASKPALRIWLDIGTQEQTQPVKQLRDALKAKGWVLDSDLVYFEAEGARHSDEAFGRRASRFIKYLFPAQSTPK